MGSLAKLRAAPAAPEEPPLSPLRRELAMEIARNRLLAERHAALVVACDAARESVWAGRVDVERAEGGVEAAKAAAATHLVDLANGTAGAAPVTIRAARAALVDAEDDLAAREAARVALDAQLAEAKHAPEFARQRLRDAALAVVREEAAEIAQRCVERVEQLQMQITKAGFELQWLFSAAVIPHDDGPGRAEYAKDSRVNMALSRLRSPVTSWNELHKHADLRSDVAWAAAVDRLMLDATAPLAAIAD